MAAAMAELRSVPPDTVAGQPVHRFDDLLGDDTGWPPTDAVILELDGDIRLVVRPSGTEPKLKIYAELQAAEPGPDLRAAEARLDAQLAEILAAAPGDLGLA